MKPIAKPSHPTSILSQQIQTYGVGVRGGLLSPFNVLRALIETRLQGNKTLSDSIFRWITFQCKASQSMPKVMAFPSDIGLLCGRVFVDATPMLTAIMIWSRMKFHLMYSKHIDPEMKEMLINFIRDIELTLKNGVMHHVVGDQCVISSMSYEEFCEFALLCISPAQYVGGVI